MLWQMTWDQEPQLSTLSKWSWAHTNDQQQKESIAHALSGPPYHPKDAQAASSLGVTNNHFKWDILCSTVQILDSFICKSLRGHWWSVSARHLLDKERRWNHGLHGKQNCHWLWRGEQVQLISIRKIIESLGWEGPHRFITVYGSALGGLHWIHLSLLLASLHGGLHHQISDFDWHTPSLHLGKNVLWRQVKMFMARKMVSKISNLWPIFKFIHNEAGH